MPDTPMRWLAIGCLTGIEKRRDLWPCTPNEGCSLVCLYPCSLVADPFDAIAIEYIAKAVASTKSLVYMIPRPLQSLVCYNCWRVMRR